MRTPTRSPLFITLTALVGMTLLVPKSWANGPRRASVPSLEAQLFPKLEKVIGQRTAEYETFLNILATNTGAFERLDVTTSDATRIALSFDGKAITTNQYDISRKTLLMGNSNCVSQENLNSIPVQIHEYSHSIFEPNLQQRLRNEFLATANHSKDYFTKVLQNDPKAEELPVDMRTASQPFHELFADSATALILNDPKALSEYFLKCKDLKDERDFSFSYPIAGWNVGRLGGIMDNRHQVFNPTRTYIWEVYTSKIASHKDGKAKLLKAIFEASVVMIQEIYQKKMTMEEWASVNQESLNRRMIELIDAQLK